MDPATIISSILTLVIGKLIDSYFTRSKKYPKYIGSVAYLKNKLKKREVFKMNDLGWKSILGTVSAVCTGLVATITGVISDPIDPVRVWGGITAIAFALGIGGIAHKAIKLSRQLKQLR